MLDTTGEFITEVLFKAAEESYRKTIREGKLSPVIEMLKLHKITWFTTNNFFLESENVILESKNVILVLADRSI